jgi:hypothetical protein
MIKTVAVVKEYMNQPDMSTDSIDFG